MPMFFWFSAGRRKDGPGLARDVNQMPGPYSIISIECERDSRAIRQQSEVDIDDLRLPNLVARITDYQEPRDIIAVLLKLMGKVN